MATVRFLGGGRGDGDGRSREQSPNRKPEAPDARSTRSDRDAKTAVELPAIPEKIYFRIGEVAHLVGVEPHVLRYWEHEFRSIRPTKSQRGQRVYSRRDVEHLRRIRSLLYEQGFTIAGAKKALRARGIEPREANDPTLVAGNRAREALVEIRTDVEAFLRELGG
jgi:DNA-binding transcriptional MerR regulator